MINMMHYRRLRLHHPPWAAFILSIHFVIWYGAAIIVSILAGVLL